MDKSIISESFWRGKKVFLTGHTGFKGGWLSLWLSSMGAKVYGYSLSPNTTPNLYDSLGIGALIESSMISDIRDLEALQKAMTFAKPDLVMHMAAQPLVRYSYVNPVETYQTNVMGTVNVLEASRHIPTIKATVVVTTDKCYENKEWAWGYRENEPMGGYDPYSSSKGCAELVAAAYRQSFFSVDNAKALGKNLIATGRAGNVIGGGDWSGDRLIPDAIRAFEVGNPLLLRNPASTRPWQHVLEPLSGYLVLAQGLLSGNEKLASGWNFGPRDEDARSVSSVIELLANRWGNDACWKQDGDLQPHEANFLKLDCSKAKLMLGWTPRWSLETAIEKIVEWNDAFKSGKSMRDVTLSQISQYLAS